MSIAQSVAALGEDADARQKHIIDTLADELIEAQPRAFVKKFRKMIACVC